MNFLSLMVVFSLFNLAKAMFFFLLLLLGALSELKVAWCSWGSNTINILDMQGNRINDSYQGAQLKGGGLHTFIEQMPNYNYIISLNKSERRFANFEVFDTSVGMHSVFNLREIQGRIMTISLSQLNFYLVE